MSQRGPAWSDKQPAAHRTCYLSLEYRHALHCQALSLTSALPHIWWNSWWLHILWGALQRRHAWWRRGRRHTGLWLRHWRRLLPLLLLGPKRSHRWRLTPASTLSGCNWRLQRLLLRLRRHTHCRSVSPAVALSSRHWCIQAGFRCSLAGSALSQAAQNDDHANDERHHHEGCNHPAHDCTDIGAARLISCACRATGVRV